MVSFKQLSENLRNDKKRKTIFLTLMVLSLMAIGLMIHIHTQEQTMQICIEECARYGLDVAECGYNPGWLDVNVFYSCAGYANNTIGLNLSMFNITGG